MQNAVTYEMSLDGRVFIREVYTFLDLLGDIGGLFGALTPLCVFLVSVCQYQSSYQFVMADMFTDRTDNEVEIDQNRAGEDLKNEKGKGTVPRFMAGAKTGGRVQRKNDIQWNSLRSILINIQAKVPQKWLCRCFKPKGRQQKVL